MNVIDNIIAEVTAEIPPQILRMAISTANREFRVFNNVQQFIVQKIIRERVLLECNLIGGKPKNIVLKAQYREVTTPELSGLAGSDGGYDIYRIPPEFRDGSSICQVLTIQYPFTGTHNAGMGGADVDSGGYNLVNQANEILNSYTLANPRNHPTGEVLSGDIIKITPSMYGHCDWLATVRIAYDDNFSNIHVSAVNLLTELIVYATKAWIYNNLIIDIDRAAVECGADIGSVRSIIEEYRDSNVSYKELKPKFTTAAMLDHETRRRLIHYQL